jgi:tRNA (guanine-N7-)-methyltransferase
MQFFADNEAGRIYLNFSDPWPKNRHEKRRLTFHAFLEKYQSILASNGEIVLKTDNRGLFEYSLESFSAFGMRLEEVNLDLHQLQDLTNIETEYEEKFSNKGQVIYRSRARY